MSRSRGHDGAGAHRVARAERLRAFDNGVLNERAHVDQFRVEAGELFFKAGVRIYPNLPVM